MNKLGERMGGPIHKRLGRLCHNLRQVVCVHTQYRSNIPQPWLSSRLAYRYDTLGAMIFQNGINKKTFSFSFPCRKTIINIQLYRCKYYYLAGFVCFYYEKSPGSFVNMTLLVLQFGKFAELVCSAGVPVSLCASNTYCSKKSFFFY